MNNAANESKDAITGRIIQTVNMMKEVLQGNLGLRETIQKQSELIDEQNQEIYQLQNENEDLRERLQVLEDFTGKDSETEMQKLVREKRGLEQRIQLLENTNINWMRQGTAQNREYSDMEPQRPNMMGQNSNQRRQNTNGFESSDGFD